MLLDSSSDDWWCAACFRTETNQVQRTTSTLGIDTFGKADKTTEGQTDILCAHPAAWDPSVSSNYENFMDS